MTTGLCNLGVKCKSLHNYDYDNVDVKVLRRQLDNLTGMCWVLAESITNIESTIYKMNETLRHTSQNCNSNLKETKNLSLAVTKSGIPVPNQFYIPRGRPHHSTFMTAEHINKRGSVENSHQDSKDGVGARKSSKDEADSQLRNMKKLSLDTSSRKLATDSQYISSKKVEATNLLTPSSSQTPCKSSGCNKTQLCKNSATTRRTTKGG